MAVLTPINGTNGNDTLNGSTDADLLIGGLGDDSYFVNNSGDIITENEGAGTDRVVSSVIGYTLAANVENLVLTTNAVSGFGNDLDNIISGAGGSSFLYGGGGNDTLVDGSTLVDTGALISLGSELVKGLGGSVGFGEDVLPRNDDSYSSSIDITSVFGASGLNFFGTHYTTLVVNNNGNLTFTGGLSTFTPATIGQGYNAPIIAAFWADVDTRGGVLTAPTPGGNSQGTNQVFYDLDATNGIFTATWDDVGYFSSHNDKANAFQIQLIKHGDNGDFDIVFRYETINWTTGDASRGTNGLGGVPARVGYTAGNGVGTFELPISGNQEQILALDEAPGNTGRIGVYVYEVRGGAVQDGTVNENDILNGGAGNDTMAGGKGNDFYVVDALGDDVREADGEGVDTVQSSISYTLGDYVENLTLIGSAAIKGTGNTLNNKLIGNAANDTLDGGAGNDTMNGGQGNDTYIVDSIDDVVAERSDSTTSIRRISENQTITSEDVAQAVRFSDGTKELFVSNASDLVAGDTNGVADLFLRDLTTGIVSRIGASPAGGEANGASYRGQFSADGTRVVFVSSASNLVIDDHNGLQDVFVKDLTTGIISRVNTSNTGVEANGISGNAVFKQGSSDIVQFKSKANNLVADDDNAADDGFEVTLAYVGGVDAVQSSVSYTLKDDGNIENLTLLDTAAVINGTGNARDNIIIGNAGNNTLMGGNGNDTVTGFDGNDTLIGDDGNDSLDGGNGDDTIKGGNGSDILNGGADNDVAVYDSAWANYTIAGDATNMTSATVTDAAGIVDTLTSIEGLKFAGTAVVTSIASAFNDTPIGVADTNTNDVVVEESTAIAGDALATGNVLTNDTDADSSLGLGETKAVSAINGNSANVGRAVSGIYGSVVINSDGSYTYTLDNVDADTNALASGQVATDTFSYTVVDAHGAAGTTTLTISITGSNDVSLSGTATAVLAAGIEDTAYTVNASDLLAGFSDGSGGSTLSITNLISNHGDVVDNQNGTYTITPTANYNGQVTLTYSVKNNTNDTLVATQSLTLTAVNDAPVLSSAAAVLAAGTEDSAYTVSAAQLLQGFSDADGNSLSIANVTTNNGTIVANQNGTYTLTPAANYNGQVVLAYNVMDGNGGSVTGSQTINFSAVDDAITGTATAVLANGIEDTSYIVQASDLLQGFSDVDGALHVGQLTATNASVVNNQNGTYTLTPVANYNGQIALTYNVTDGNGDSVAATQRIQVAAVNDAPTGAATATLANAIENRVYLIKSSDLLQGFSDIDSSALSVASITSSQGVVTDNQNGTYTLKPPRDYHGAIQLSYNVIDGAGGSVAATQQVSVVAVTQNIMGTAGADTLTGGSGNDAFIVNNTGDVVIESNNPSIDTVLASVDYALTANVDHLTLTGTANINGTGNSLNNIIKGNDGNNRLDGGDGDDILWGGAGVDTLIGGQGNDSYHVDNVNDMVTESANVNDFDTVYSSVDYTLAINVERLILEGSAVMGMGNNGNNTLEGNNANNVLVGGAGDDRLDGMVGADTLIGGTGSDLYTVDNAGDVVTELANEGVDAVNSSIDYTLTANVERLFLMGSANVMGAGNDLHNTVYGNNGNNLLSGGVGNDTLNGQAGNDTLDGGIGNDYLKGGLGDDTYVFGLNAGRDTIDNTDVGNGNDKVLFTAGVTADQVWLRQVNADLEVSIIGTNDRVLISGWYSSAAKQVDSLQLADGKTLLASEVQTLVAAMAAFTSPPPLGQTTLTANQHTALDSVIAASW